MLAGPFHVETLMLVDALVLPVRLTSAFFYDPPSERRQILFIACHLKCLASSRITERSYPIHDHFINSAKEVRQGSEAADDSPLQRYRSGRRTPQPFSGGGVSVIRSSRLASQPSTKAIAKPAREAMRLLGGEARHTSPGFVC